MSRFTQQTSWGRGEVEPKLAARQDADFYGAAAARLSNWLPDAVAGISTRKGFAALRDIESTIDSEFGVLTLQPRQQNLLGYVFRAEQVLIHLGVYTAENGNQHIVVTPIRTLVNLIDTDSPADVSAATAQGGRYVSAAAEVPDDALFEVSMSVAGPAAFITHELLPVLRVFPNTLTVSDAIFDVEPVQFYQELFGFVTVENGATLWTGSEEAFFTEQLEAGDIIKFRNQIYTVASTGTTDPDPDTGEVFDTFTTEETYGGVTVTDRVAKQDDAAFGGENPSLVGFFQSRLVLARTPSLPTGLWMSKSNDPFTIVPSAVADDSPINAELFAEGADEFTWMTGGERLYLGSGLGEYSLGSSDASITPTQLRFFRIGNNGGARVTPANVDGTVLFVNRPRSQVLSVAFDFGRQAFNTSNLSLLAEHLTRDVVDLTFRPPVTNDRTPRVFALTRTRELRAFALSQASQVAAWGRVEHSPAFTVQAVAATSEFLFCVTLRTSGKVELGILRNE
jgi:hypothetical protein